MALKTRLIRLLSAPRLREIDRFMEHPAQVQQRQLRRLLDRAAPTLFGTEHGFHAIRTAEQFASRVPVTDYDGFTPYIERMRRGEADVCWPGEVRWFAKSSGTTSAKSKFIPVSREGLRGCHMRGPLDIVCLTSSLWPDTDVFSGKTLTLGGSRRLETTGGRAQEGDLSAILIENTPWLAGRMRVPKPETALIPDFEKKVEAICRETVGQNVTAFAGVPSWNLVMLRKVLEFTGKSNLLEVWPRLELFTHGGMNFKPYREQYRQLIPSDRMKYMETYNASEGFFGLQDDPSDSSMLLMLDYGVYYEFVPISELTKPHPRALLLEEVENGVNYALVISTNGGLWRYMIGDTIMFTSTRPYKFKITGRTKLFINAFGEELIIDNAIEALKQTCEKTGATVMAFTAAPVFMEDGKKGAHEWIIEFGTPPADSENFANILDTELKKINSDYEAKRYKDMSLQRLILHAARPNLFNDWLKEKGKLGGQNKVPQLWNDRTHIDELLKMNQG